MNKSSQIVTAYLNSKDRVSAKALYLSGSISMDKYNKWSALEIGLSCGGLSDSQLDELADLITRGWQQ